MEEHVEALTPEEDRARRELVEFRSRYPEVSLSREELLRLAPEMVGENPKTLTEAYRSWQEAEKDREIAELRLSWRLRPRIRKIGRPLPAPSPTPARPRPPGPMTNFYLPIRDKNGTA